MNSSARRRLRWVAAHCPLKMGSCQSWTRKFTRGSGEKICRWMRPAHFAPRGNSRETNGLECSVWPWWRKSLTIFSGPICGGTAMMISSAMARTPCSRRARQRASFLTILASDSFYFRSAPAACDSTGELQQSKRARRFNSRAAGLVGATENDDVKTTRHY